MICSSVSWQRINFTETFGQVRKNASSKNKKFSFSSLSFLLLYVCIKMNTDEKYNRLCLELLLSNSNKITRLNPNEKDKYLKY